MKRAPNLTQLYKLVRVTLRTQNRYAVIRWLRSEYGLTFRTANSMVVETLEDRPWSHW